MSSSRSLTAVFCIALVGVVAFAFLPGLSGGFIFDDYPNIVRETRVHATEISMASLADAAGAYDGPIGRPIATMSFAVDHALGGLDPRGYKVVNLLVHLINAVLVYALVVRLLALTGLKSRWAPGAAAIALLWAVHPLQVSTVLYVVQRMEMLSLTFVLVALLAYLRARRNQTEGARGWPWVAACVAAGVLGMLCKETAVLLPVFALALEASVLRFTAKAAWVSRAWRLAYGAGAVLGLVAAAVLLKPYYSDDNTFAIREYGALERVLTQLRVLPMYLGWILVPQPGSYTFYHDDFVHSEGLLRPWTTLAGAIMLAALLTAAVALRRRMPLFSLGVFWFFAAHLLTSSMLPLELVFEHRNYFALLGVLLAVTDVARRIPLTDVRMRGLTAGLLIVGYVAMTLVRSATWGDEMNLAMELASKNPHSSRASLDLGELYLRLAHKDASSPYFAKGVAELERGSRVPNASPVPEQGLIVYSAEAGVPARPEWWDRLIHKLETRAIGPQEMTMLVDLLKMRRDGLVFDDARFADAYLVLVRRVQLPAVQYYAFAEHAQEDLGDVPLAIKLFELAVAGSRDDPDFVAAMVDTLWKQGHAEAAEAVAAKARALGVADIGMPDRPAPSEPANPTH